MKMISLVINAIDICGGTHKQFLRLSEYLKSQEIEFEILTVYYNQDKTYPEFSQFEIKHIAKDKKKITNIFFRKISLIINQIKLFNQIDNNSKIVNIHDNGLSIVIFLSWITGKRVYWQINDLPGCFLVGNSKGIKTNIIKKSTLFIIRVWYKYFVSKFVTNITVNVSKNRDRVKNKLGIDATVLYPGVDKWKGRKRTKKHYEKQIKILSSGVFFPYRNYETQLLVVGELKNLGFDIQLNVIGSTELDPVYTQKIYELIKKHKLEKNINILGQVDEDKYISLHQDSDLFIFINIDQSWGLAVFEAMGSGLPVIVSNSVGATELLTDGENALFVEPTNIKDIVSAILKLSDKYYYQKISDNAQTYVQKFTWDNMYSSKLINLIKNWEEK